MRLLLATHPTYLEHDTGSGHPERPSRLDAVFAGIDAAGLRGALIPFAPRPASLEEVHQVHEVAMLARLEAIAAGGGGAIDPDTVASSASYDAALLAAGAGLEAIERLDAGEAEAAFCAVRPPGHHATPSRAMGFCLVNNVAVAASRLAARGERVLIVDYDAHHGNGTQDIFYADPRVAYVSLHQYPLYPGSGAADEVGVGAGRGTTVNLPMPAGATGEVYRAAFDRVVLPFAERFAPTWLLVSAGFDAHRRDPLTQLGLTSGDFADLTVALMGLVPAGCRLLFLEGGYDLQGLAASAGATLAALAEVPYRPEPASAHGPGLEVVEVVEAIQQQFAD